VLEVGCGVGVAAGLICRRLTTGHLTALDRSATALERAQRRLADYLEDGRADLQHRELARFTGDGRPYDLVFAVNVNVFWTGSATQEVERLTDLVAEGGVVRLFYETPDDEHSRRAETWTASALRDGGFRTETIRPPGMVCVTGWL
jgi:trans-aconitate methyltransferase